MFRQLKVDWSRFYNTTITVYKKTKASGYSDDEETKENIYTSDADVQPYSGDMARKEYGLEIDKGLKVFCPDNDIVKTGMYMDYEGDVYIIKYIEHWASGAVMILERCKNA